MSLQIGTAPASSLAKIVDTLQASVVCNGVGSGNANLVKSFSLPSIHGANTMYRLNIRYTINSLGANGFLLLRIKSGANTVDTSLEVDDNAANGTCAATITIMPLTTTSVGITATCIRGGNVPATTSYITTSATPGGATTWAAQTAIDVLGYVSTIGNVTVQGIFMECIAL
jgi:hypothetical protein